MKKLSNKVAIITGAAAGVGQGIAEVFAREGAHIALWDIDTQVEDLAKELADKYQVKALGQKVDVANKAEVQAAVQAVADHFGQVDIIGANAGVCRLAAFEEFPDDLLDLHLNVNIKGVWNTCQLAIPHLLKQGGGSIVIASSVTGDLVADAGEAAYALTKSALVGLTKCLAMEYADRNIRVNCTQLGYARTPMVEKMAVESNPENPESVIDGIAIGVPMKRLAKPEEVGELFAFLASEESSYITGGQFVIDGGATLPETMTMGTN